jgi:hypothetical protein
MHTNIFLETVLQMDSRSRFTFSSAYKDVVQSAWHSPCIFSILYTCSLHVISNAMNINAEFSGLSNKTKKCRLQAHLIFLSSPSKKKFNVEKATCILYQFKNVRRYVKYISVYVSELIYLIYNLNGIFWK